MRVPRSSLLFLMLLAMLGSAAAEANAARRDAGRFILETLGKQQGDTWERVGRFMFWTYSFDRSGCLLSVQREADFGDLFQQRIPLANATVVGAQNSEIVFDCRDGEACIDYNSKSRRGADERSVARARLLVMDTRDINPLMNAFAELHQLCRDPYAPGRLR